jgi:hypothetical protein
MHILTTIGRDRFGFVVVAALPAPLAPTISSVNQLAIFFGPNELVPPIFFLSRGEAFPFTFDEIRVSFSGA